MFGREVRITLPKTKKIKSAVTDEDKTLDPETITLIKENVIQAAKGIAAVVVTAYAIIKTIDTLSEIAVKKTKPGENE